MVTSFLVQISQNLQADFSEITALLLHDLLNVQLSTVNGATVNVTTPSVNPAAKFDPDAIDVWINGLWVVSLVTSLVVALSAVLVKQWLHRYMTFPSGTPGLRSHVRQFRFMGLEKWRVRFIIGMLPIVMHISLMLFFAGLALFYVPLRASLAWTVGTITVLVCVLYLVSNAIPIIFPQCPYQTPLTDFIHHVCQTVSFGIQSLRHYCFVAHRGIHKPAVPSQQQASDVLQTNLKSLTQLESDAVRDAHDTLSVDALDWLYQMSSNPTVHTLVLQGISGLPDESHSYALTKWRAATNMQSQRNRLVLEVLPILDCAGQLQVMERLCRSSLFLPMGDETIWPTAIREADSGNWDPHIEAVIWHAYGQRYYDYIDFFIRHSEVRMQPLIWEVIIRSALDQYSQSAWNVAGNVIDESILAQFLSAVLVVLSSPGGPFMTGPQVVSLRLHSQFWDRVLRTPLLAPYDSAAGASISTYHRTLIAAGNLALSKLRLYRHNDIDNLTVAQQKHLELLARVVGLIAGHRVMPNKDYCTVDCDFLINVLQEFRDISFTATIESDRSLCLDHIRSFYLQSSCMYEFHFPGLDVFLQSWAGFYNSVQYDSTFSYDQPSNLKTPIQVMGHALSRGHDKVYRLFTSRGWMGIVFTEWAICGGTGTSLELFIGGYIEGLRTLTSISNRREFCQYLHQPQQLILAFMLIIATGVDQHIVKLAKICPSHASWSGCHSALQDILTWAQTPNPEISLFPWPSSLQSLNTTEAFRK